MRDLRAGGHVYVSTGGPHVMRPPPRLGEVVRESNGFEGLVVSVAEDGWFDVLWLDHPAGVTSVDPTWWEDVMAVVA